ncbi:B-cell receptor CD22-like, partial [Anguilla rostrata]|uniref:B-cell receptor CD22-like n=1 Tax=Anguilla rostrata TaxID=7938 RepID=UPI0030CB0669
LHVKVTEYEEQNVTLTCSSTCTLSGSPTFTWYKNRKVVPYEYKYSLNVASTEDTDLYSCATGGVTSPAVNVKYAPKNTSVSVIPSGEIVEGSSVTLTCSSDANPPVQNYTWYRKGGSTFLWRGSERSNTINKVNSSDAGEYYCEAENAIGTKRSLPKRLGVQYPPKSVSVSVSPSGEIVEGSSVTLTCSSSDANPPVHIHTWFKNRAELSWRGSSYNFKSITLQDAGEYYCAAGNGIWTKTSPPIRLDVQYPPMGISVSVSPSGEIVEGSSVTLTCSSDVDPPVQKYTWLKKTGSVFSSRGTERSYIIKNITQQDAGEYYCEAENAIGTKRSTSKHLDVQCGDQRVNIS